MRKIVFSILFIVFCLQFSAYADMGAIVPYNINVNEYAQKAIILHNEKEEVLILGTDLHSENETKILRFIPLPAEPKVSKVDADVFKVSLSLMKKYEVVFVRQNKALFGPSKSPIEIRLHKKIGAHNVTVIKVNSVSYFRSWVNQFFKKNGLPQKEKYPFVGEIVRSYVKRGIRYFIFDLVNVTKNTASVAPLAYKFKTDKIYYPLITSNSFDGGKLKLISALSEHGRTVEEKYTNKSEIDLIFITPKTLFRPVFYYNENYNYRFLRLPKPVNGAKGYWEVSTSAYLPKKEIEALYPKSNEFFKHNEHLIMQFVRYRGIYNFDKDIYSGFSKCLPIIFLR